MDFLSIFWTVVVILAIIGIGALLVLSLLVIFYLMITGKRWD